MRDLARRRLRKNWRQSLKYLMLVFNDFFILALIFLFSALMFWYAQEMKTIRSGLWFYRPLSLFILWLPLISGKLVTLLQEADMQFLLPQDDSMAEYLQPLAAYSMVLPTILLLLLGVVMWPFATIKAGINDWIWLLFVAGTVAIKYCMLVMEEANLRFGRRVPRQLMLLLALIVLLLGCIGPLIYLLAIVFVFVLTFALKLKNSSAFDWHYAIRQERKRKDAIYAVFSMFTDVRERQVVIRRRKYLDFLLPRKLQHESPNLFLYSRSLLRNPDYLNLLVRMTIFAVLVSWLVQDWRFATGLSFLVMFMTAFQLLPLGHEFDRNVMYRVYPIVKKNRSRDLVKVLQNALYLQWLLIIIFWLILLPVNLHLAYAAAMLLLLTAILAYGYLPTRFKEKKSGRR